MSRPEDISSATREALDHPDGIPTLGSLLVVMRKQYALRLSPSSLAVKVTARSVIEALDSQKYGYGMTSGSYSLLEQSKTLPKSPRQFLSSIGKIFDLNSGEMWVLMQAYRHDRDKQVFGDKVANRFRPLGLKDAYNAMLLGERLPEVEDPQIREAMEALKQETPVDRKRRYSSTQE